MGDRRCLGFLTSGGLQLQAACSSTSQVHGQQRVRSLSSDLVRGRPRCLLTLLGLPSSGVALSNPEVWPGRLGSVGAQVPTLSWNGASCRQKSKDQQGTRRSLQKPPSFPPHLSKCCVSESGVETWKMSQAGDAGMAGLGARLIASLLLPLGPGRPARSSPPGCRPWGCPWILFPRSTDTASSSVGRRGPV